MAFGGSSDQVPNCRRGPGKSLSKALDRRPMPLAAYRLSPGTVRREGRQLLGAGIAVDRLNPKANYPAILS